MLLVVNTASQCGYTPQYEGLEKLYRRYRDRGLVVLGFPANDFGGQEPGSNKQIADFCQVNYGVSFPVFAKTAVVGANANPVFRDLAAKTGSAPRWNFHKYLVDRDGVPVASFATQVEPLDPKLTREIERLLGASARRRPGHHFFSGSATGFGAAGGGSGMYSNTRTTRFTPLTWRAMLVASSASLRVTRPSR